MHCVIEPVNSLYKKIVFFLRITKCYFYPFWSHFNVISLANFQKTIFLDFFVSWCLRNEVSIVSAPKGLGYWQIVWCLLIRPYFLSSGNKNDPVGVLTLYSWRKLATHVVLLLASRVANEAKFVLFMSCYNLDAFQMSLNAWHRQSTVTLWQVNQIVQGRPTNLSATLKYGNAEKGKYDLPNFGRYHTACVAARPCCCCVLNLW